MKRLIYAGLMAIAIISAALFTPSANAAPARRTHAAGNVRPSKPVPANDYWGGLSRSKKTAELMTEIHKAFADSTAKHYNEADSTDYLVKPDWSAPIGLEMVAGCSEGYADFPAASRAVFAQINTECPDGSYIVVVVGTNDAVPWNWVNSASQEAGHQSLVARDRATQASMLMPNARTVVPEYMIQFPDKSPELRGVVIAKLKARIVVLGKHAHNTYVTNTYVTNNSCCVSIGPTVGTVKVPGCKDDLGLSMFGVRFGYGRGYLEIQKEFPNIDDDLFVADLGFLLVDRGPIQFGLGALYYKSSSTTGRHFESVSEGIGPMANLSLVGDLNRSLDIRATGTAAGVNNDIDGGGSTIRGIFGASISLNYYPGGKCSGPHYRKHRRGGSR